MYRKGYCHAMVLVLKLSTTEIVLTMCQMRTLQRGYVHWRWLQLSSFKQNSKTTDYIDLHVILFFICVQYMYMYVVVYNMPEMQLCLFPACVSCVAACRWCGTRACSLWTPSATCCSACWSTETWYTTKTRRTGWTAPWICWLVWHYCWKLVILCAVLIFRPA